VDGRWSKWEESECSATCGGGMLVKSRTCTEPSPSCGGSDCEGENYTNATCNTQCCPGTYVKEQLQVVCTDVKFVLFSGWWMVRLES